MNALPPVGSDFRTSLCVLVISQLTEIQAEDLNILLSPCISLWVIIEGFLSRGTSNSTLGPGCGHAIPTQARITTILSALRYNQYGKIAYSI